jgi:hypothetical protein
MNSGSIQSAYGILSLAFNYMITYSHICDLSRTKRA